MKKQLFLIVFMTILSLSFSNKAIADDIEIYVNSLLNKTEKARVMLMFDTSGSMRWSSVTGKECYYKASNLYYYSMECSTSSDPNSVDDKCYHWNRGYYQVTCVASRMQVAKNAVNQLIDSTEDVDFGLARFGANSNGDNSSGYILYGIGSAESKDELKAKINGLPATGATPLMDSAFEIYSYLSGENVFEAGRFGDRDKSIESGNKYDSPFKRAANGKLRCDNNAYVIYMTDGDPNNGTSAKSKIKTLSGSSSNNTTELLPELAKYMANNDIYSSTDEDNFVYTYTIGFGNGMSDSAITMLENMASDSYGKGQYEDATDADKLSKSLTATINDILDRVGNFTSPSVAASQSDNTRTKDFVYYSLFSPSGFSKWNGNVKKLKISGYNVVDQAGNNAIDTNGGILGTAKTFWKPTNNQGGSYSDGSNVTVGGLEDNIGAPNSRKMYTDVDGFSELLISNDDVVSAVREAMNSEAEDNDAKQMIEWMRGINGYDTNGNPLVRDHILGDALHSKPAAITYDVGGSSDKTYLIYGTNAGFVHFFEDTSDTVANEAWSFIPKELFPIQESLRDNGLGKVYGMDLTPTIYHDDVNGDGKVNSNEKVMAFFGMRRGGNSYYALDISKRNEPELLWKITAGDAGFSNLGQTWSQPKLIYVNHQQHSGDPLLVFGAGYDKAQFEEGEENTVGAGIYLIKALTKELVWSSDSILFEGNDSITGRIATLDSDYDGYTDRLYAADTGGKIWRFDLAGKNSGNWSAYKFAELNGHFFYQPEVARSFYSKVTNYEIEGNVTNVTRASAPFEAVVVGTGDRTNPLNLEGSDTLYMLRDLNVITKSYKSNAPGVISSSNLMPITPDTFGSLTSTPNEFIKKERDYANYQGWKYQLEGSGEKALAKPAIIGGVAYFPTFIAGSTGSSSCTLTGGQGKLYAFHLHYAASIYDNPYYDTGDSIPPTPELFYSENSDENSQFLLIGVGAGEGNSGIIQAKSIVDSAIPVIKDGKIQLTAGFAGFKTHRTYIYRESSNRVN
jgi:type IV pilus assembly protein PilY1